MADAVVSMKAVWDGRALQRGMAEAKGHVGAFKSVVGKASAFMRGPLGFLGVGIAVGDLVLRLKDLGEEERQILRLTSTVKRFAGVNPDLRALNATMVSLRRNTLFGDTELTASLQMLTQITQDYTGSLKNLGLVTDVAAATGKSLNEVTRLVGFAMKGIIEPLGEIDPMMRIWAQNNRELVGTVEGARQAIDMLTEAVSGSAGDEAGGFTGAVHRAKTGWDEWVDSILEGSGKIPAALNAWGTYWEMVAEANRLSKEMEDYWGSRERRGAGRFGSGPPKLGALPIPPDGYTGESPPAGFLQGDAVNGTYNVGGGPGSDLIGETYLAQQKQITDQMRARNTLAGLIAESEQRVVEIRDEHLLPSMGEEIKLRNIGADLARESRIQTEQMASYLGAQFTNAFFDIENGWKNMLENMARMMVQKGLTNLFMGLLTGGTATPLAVGAGAVTGSGSILQGPQLPGGGFSFGSNRAAYNQASWRMTRSAIG